MQQVVWNLLSNAIKFTPSGGLVKLGVRERGPQVEIKVTDNGQGISEEFLPFVFDRFRQADSTTTRQHGGLGLGLAIPRHLVEIHGGNMKAESDGLEKGSTFLVMLPRLGAEVKGHDDAKDAPWDPFELIGQHAGIHVLLVDDDDDTLQLITAALAQGRARVTAVSSAAAFRLAPEIERAQIERARALRASRSATDTQAALERVDRAARDGTNLMPAVLDAVEARATLGEIADGLLGRAEIMALVVGAERPVSHALDEKLPVAFEKKFRSSANGTREHRSHSGAWINEGAE